MRTIRVNVPGATYQLISRFVDRNWYFREDEERRRYLALLGRALKDSDWRCLAYALMSSHIHIAIVAGELPMESWLKRVHSPFADWMNVRYNRIGPMFVRGPKDYAVPPHKVADVIAYIHNNPVRAKVVASAVESSWTSHRAYVGRDPVPGWLHVDEGLERTGFTAPEFDDWVSTNPEDPCRVDVAGVRRAVRKRGEIDPGTPTGELMMIPLVARRTAWIRPDPAWFVEQTAAVLGLLPGDVRSRSRHPSVTAARRIAIHAALAFGVSVSDMAAALAITTGAVSRIRYAELNPTLRRLRDVVLERVESLVGSKNRPQPRL